MRRLMWLAFPALAAGCIAPRTTPTPPPPAQPETTLYLRTHPGTSYRILHAVYATQRTPSGCSLASTTIVVNALRYRKGLPEVTQQQVLDAVGDRDWAKATAFGGDGVSFAAFLRDLRRSLDVFGFSQARIEVFRPQDASATNLARLRQVLADRQGFLLAAFDQGTLTGDVHVGHISPLAGYDAKRHRVLVMDVDRELPGPYWTNDTTLLAALVRPDPTDPTGNGVVRVIPGPQ